MATDKQVLRNFINGAYVESSSSDHFDLISPVTGEVVGRSPNSNAEDVDRAYAAAAAAFKVWGRATPSTRQKALLGLADAVERNAERLIEAQSRNTGQPKYLIASEEVATAVDQIRC